MNKTIRLCLVGGGRAGKVHANSVTRHLPGGRLTTLVEPVEDVRQVTAGQFGIESTFSSLEEALEKAKTGHPAEFDAVVITTPTFTHKALAVMAAQAGKHVFLEKPMALSLEECDAILAAVKANRGDAAIGLHAPLRPGICCG